jgi:general nucleoside transport system permease protein
LRTTRFGLEVDASGSDPGAAAAKGVNVRRTRAVATLVAGGFAGLGGAAVSVGAVGNFGQNITAGRGFVAIAVVALVRRHSLAVIPAALLFGWLDALQSRLQGTTGIPVEFMPALPWITVVVLFVLVTRGQLRARRSVDEAPVVESAP